MPHTNSTGVGATIAVARVVAVIPTKAGIQAFRPQELGSHLRLALMPIRGDNDRVIQAASRGRAEAAKGRPWAGYTVRTPSFSRRCQLAGTTSGS